MPTAAPEVMQGRSVARRETRVGVEAQPGQGFISFADLATMTLDDLTNTSQSAAQESRAAATASAETLVSAATASVESVVSASTANRETLVS